MKKTYQGSCHCGTVRFRCELDLAANTTRCNCRFCRKSRIWFSIVKEADLQVLAGADALTDYQKAPPGKEAFLHFTFCQRCGVRPFTRGGELKKGEGGFYAVNLGCLDDATDEELAKAPVHFADGRNDDWDVSSKETRYL